MSSYVHVRYMALALLFTFCQVIGTMCVLPDLSGAQEAALLEDRIACPMDGTIMCPPSLISSPDRQVKHSLKPDTDHSAALHCAAVAMPIDRSSSTLRARSSALSLVPISIDASSVLRI